MTEQIMVSVSREYGSGGHEIAERMAKALNLKLYDRSMLDEIAIQMNVDVGILEQCDEKPRNYFLSRKVGAHTNSLEEIIAYRQFEYIKEKAESGESFIIVGRCAETVLKDYKNLLRIFIRGDKEARIARVMEKYHLNEKDAKAKIARHDKRRMQYHNRYSVGKWGDFQYYDICINSAKLGVQETADYLVDYIRGYWHREKE